MQILDVWIWQWWGRCSFAPLFHQFLFSHLQGNIAILNIGGIANITF
ncbi:MAG: anhydro-N-acetylmuramic acid kinase [Sulfurimonas sp.]|nr:anhydro-N-acetylmuramic acid kinase [Sulfurimonas sp.]